jgi:putative intracellular protease/amidase
MGKILIFIFDGMTDYEITFIIHLLGADSGKEIITIAYENKIIKSRSGLLYKPTRLVSDVLNEDVEGLIICGGWYGDTRHELLQLINNLNLKNKLLGAICGAGTVFLAKAGVLKDVKYTTPIVEWTYKHIEVFGEKDPFPRENFVLERVIRDRNIITAQGIAFVDFAIEICDWFNLFESQEERDSFAKNIKGL